MKPPPGEDQITPHSKRRRHAPAPCDPTTARHNDSSGEKYRVGPGHPPREFQFKPGQSGNPNGGKGKSKSKSKAKLLRDMRAVFERALDEKVKRGDMTKFEAGCKELATQFAEGDYRARRDVFAYAPQLGIDLKAGRGSAGHREVSSEAEMRQALLDRGIPARLLPPIDEAGLEPPPGPPLPPDVEEEENKKWGSISMRGPTAMPAAFIDWPKTILACSAS